MFFSLSDFHTVKPKFKIPQNQTLSWLVDAHIQSEKTKNPNMEDDFKNQIKNRFEKVACKDENIEFRGSSIEDYQHTDWEQMEVYNLIENPSGFGLETRTKVFSSVADEIFRKLYEDCNNTPSNIIHVTCTGYTSPSPAQKLVSYKKWGTKTQITHAYHMGCYGSIPAIKIANAFYCNENKSPTDIVHTEICSLHTNPSLHDYPQIVAQSLFADGFIKYSLSKSPGMKILALHQETIDNTEDAMLWDVSEYGFKIHLAKEIPVLIARNLKQFMANMLRGTNISLEKSLEEAIFAIHPGGPKIIQNIKDILNLNDIQVDDSKKVLKSHGNMSSATLPHIWKKILENKQIHKNALVVSLAFGPGLSISGCVLKKETN